MTSTAIDGDSNATTTLDRVRRALDTYNDGGTWDDAAAAAGYTNRGTAYHAVMRWLGRQVSEKATELRAAANERHGSKIAMLEDVIYDLDQPLERRLRAADVHTRAEARHAALNGLNAPVQVTLAAGAQAAMLDALAEVEQLVRGEVLDRTDEPIPDHEATDG